MYALINELGEAKWWSAKRVIVIIEGEQMERIGRVVGVVGEQLECI